MTQPAETHEPMPDWEDHAVKALKGLRAEFKSRRVRLGDFPTPEFHEHLRLARKEVLLAMRSVLDRAIQHLETPARPGDDKPKAAHITVE